jgi:hypothetical protein
MKKVISLLFINFLLFNQSSFANSIVLSPQMEAYIQKNQKRVAYFVNGLNNSIRKGELTYDHSGGYGGNFNLLASCKGSQDFINRVVANNKGDDDLLIMWVANAKIIDEQCSGTSSYASNRSQLSFFFQFGVIDKWLAGKTSFEVENGKLQEKQPEPELNKFNY